MISRNSEGGFFAAHWDWLVAIVGVLALAVGIVMFFVSGGTDAEGNATDAVNRLMSARKSETGVKPVVMTDYERVLQQATKPPTVAEVEAIGGNFLVSARRILCVACKKPIPGTMEDCPLCGEKQPVPEKPVIDTDGDGLPDDWETANGLDAKVADADQDKDGDGFTNAEEFEAKTDPSDKSSHPDYFNFLALQLPLKETVLPFYFEKVEQLPGGKSRYYFRDPKAKSDYGTRGRQYNPLGDEEIGKTGFVVKGFEKKSEKVKIAATKTDKALERTKDVYLVTIERKADGKKLVLRDTDRRTPVDVQATLVFSRGDRKEFTVVPGGTIDLYGDKYKIVDIKSEGKGAKVTLEHTLLGKIRTIEALEQ